MEENDKPNQTNFDMACDVFYEALADADFEVKPEDANKIITPALEKFRDELRDQMGDDKFVAKYSKKD